MPAVSSLVHFVVVLLTKKKIIIKSLLVYFLHFLSVSLLGMVYNILVSAFGFPGLAAGDSKLDVHCKLIFGN